MTVTATASGATISPNAPEAVPLPARCRFAKASANQPAATGAKRTAAGIPERQNFVSSSDMPTAGSTETASSTPPYQCAASP